jgi:hypothetical protein
MFIEQVGRDRRFACAEAAIGLLQRDDSASSSFRTSMIRSGLRRRSVPTALRML